jgi:hypothetical protein
MITLALPFVAAAALFPEVRSFWAVERDALQPAQVEVYARLVREGRSLAVYQEEGYHFSALGPADETRQIENAVRTFDDTIYPREVPLFGPCPDRDQNGKVILLVTRSAPDGGLFFPFDEMSEAEALRYGFHSNQGEVLFDTFNRQGNRAGRNIQEIAETFHRLLHYSRDPGETSWSRLLANYAPYRCGLVSARLLWGDIDPEGHTHTPADPWTSRGWSLLFVEYLRDKLGEESLRDLVLLPETGLAGVGRLLANRGERRTANDLLADFAMACWFDDPALAEGRFAFSTVVPPRPLPAARAVASRPTSGAIDVGVGGMVFLIVDGNGERPFPLTLQGDASVGWVARAVKLRTLGPDVELPIAFAPNGVAKLDLPALAPDESVVVAAVAVPGESPLFDRRTLLLRWGIGWVPHAPADQGREALAKLVTKAFPAGGAAARSRLMATLDRLSGAPAEGVPGPVVTTRYAWAPAAADVVEVLHQEAERRGLPARSSSFVQHASNGAEQTWSNVLVELPGSDPRRWPIVLAAHWDGAREHLSDSYLRALNVNDDASGVAVAMEAAAAMSRTPHRAPIVVALLAGGYHDAAGARALLDDLGGKISAWIEINRVGIPDHWPRTLWVTLEGGTTLSKFPFSVPQEFRRAGFTPKTRPEIADPHTGGALAAARGIPSLVICELPGAEGEGLDTPPAVERARMSPDLMVLFAKTLASTVVNLAGTP